MRGTLCMLLSVMLFCLLIFGASLPPSLPAVSSPSAAWWGLFCPALFQVDSHAVESDSVTFSWPLLNRLLCLFRLSA